MDNEPELKPEDVIELLAMLDAEHDKRVAAAARADLLRELLDELRLP